MDRQRTGWLHPCTCNYSAYGNGYGLLFSDWYIPLNGRISLPETDSPLNETGIPCCLKDHSLPMKREGSKSHLRCGLSTIKFVCPKMKWVYDKETSCGRMVYLYPEKVEK